MIFWHNPDTAMVEALVRPASRRHHITRQDALSLATGIKLIVSFSLGVAGLLALIILAGAFAP